MSPTEVDFIPPVQLTVTNYARGSDHAALM